MATLVCRGRQNLDNDPNHILVCGVSGEQADKPYWKVLTIWWRKDEHRPFLSVIETQYASRVNPSDYPGLTPFRTCAYGSVWTALDFFDDTGLRIALTQKIPDDVNERFPNANELRAQIAQERRLAGGIGYHGAASIAGALAWLYGPEAEAMSNNALASRFEEDFGVKARTVRTALDTPDREGSWTPAFLNALKFFDRAAWERAKREKSA